MTLHTLLNHCTQDQNQGTKNFRGMQCGIIYVSLCKSLPHSQTSWERKVRPGNEVVVEGVIGVLCIVVQGAVCV